MDERDQRFFAPLWRRVALIAALAVWSAVEWWHGNSLWGVITLALTLWSVWAYLIRFDNAAAEAFSSTLEWEVLSRHQFTNPDHAQQVVAEWCWNFYNTSRRHSSVNQAWALAASAISGSVRPSSRAVLSRNFASRYT